MCGIVGIIGKQDVAPLLVEGLKRLEYRGYDSAGIATLVGGQIERRRAEGKLANLAALLEQKPVAGGIGIGHTRWATHGVPNERNAHPHATKRVAVVHNGIIENFQELKAELSAVGQVFESDTDTEAVAQLIDHHLAQGMEPVAATEKALERLRGAFALGIIFAGHPHMMIAARQGSPLALGYGEGEMYLGSDALALAPLTQRISYLLDGDWAVLTTEGATIRDRDGQLVTREVRQTQFSGAMIGKGQHRHFMLKEIFEQPEVIGGTLNTMLNPAERTITLPTLPFDLASVGRVRIIACGTSYYAGSVAKYWIEKVARLPVEVDIASEFRYREPPMEPGGLAIFISQSGETADTLAALRYCRANHQHTLALVNVPESTISRESEATLLTLAGPEIGVASTKAFTTQLVVLACLAVGLGRARGAITRETEATICQALAETPARIAEFLRRDDEIHQIAQGIAEARDVLYLGRGTGYPIALEGALKLKEISYIHAEGYAAGELKHGPIALIDDSVPVIVICPTDELYEKTASNVQEVMARGGRVVFFSDQEGVGRLATPAHAAMALPTVHPFVAPILYAIPVQLLAYHVAIAKGTDVDQPRNLAKSVTVE
ncbi:glutamine--fructose-6-phosphate transaminase (isomerizing) [Paramagnetospirillum kuznetsovii]|uniref:Glutamine--fructose-6-phosphate aminotransferase [isomerizing] n=1 Tax=Paramagnetospirillum kuznetsovii TaxID=2053833 RepID=A0A364NTK3_9PROT|nr:glutamine--fructose-6-phosphate transaminase (isomerizing) [Paramagnetospirillum kuznetsovii]RAU20404.1 glutamine--fructose-6-phosphate transaminase (isomerizing) [Paramagnetospirillum kuznetsovii]